MSANKKLNYYSVDKTEKTTVWKTVTPDWKTLYGSVKRCKGVPNKSTITG